MLSVPPIIWNEIAETQPLKHPKMRKLMEMDHEELPAALDQLAKEQESAGALPRATLAFSTVAPLLLENEAISRYVQMKDNDSLRVGLPELTTVDEALALATDEYRLTGREQASLRKLLLEASARNETSNALSTETRVQRIVKAAKRVNERRARAREPSPR